MNKYKSLISNTLVFAIATFSSKLLSFVMVRFYTTWLTPAEYGAIGTIIPICNLILPVMYMCVSESIIRFGLDKTVRKSDVFTTGILTALGGYVVLWCLYPLLRTIPDYGEWMLLVNVFVLTSALRTVITHFVRASGFVRLFALDGMVTLVLTVGFNVLFVYKLKMGVVGYVMGTVLADALSALSLFVLLKLHRFMRVKQLDRSVAKEMLRFSLPLIPTAVFWWVTNLSDRLFLTYFSGIETTGFYNAAAAIPTMIMLVSAVFTQAWQISAYTEYKTREGERFFSTVFKSYYTFLFLAASGIILLVKPLASILLRGEYFDGWKYVPLLVLAAVFSCFVTFLGTIYNAEKKNLMVSVTTVIGGLVNIGMNLWLIPVYGANGAALSTFTSFFTVFLIRAVDTRKYLKIRLQPFLMALNLILLLIQAGIALAAPPYWVLWEIGILLALLACNLKHLLFLVKHLYGMVFPGKAA